MRQGKAIICSHGVRGKKDKEMEKELGKWCIGRSREGEEEEKACLPVGDQPKGACYSTSPFLEFKA